MNVRNGVSKTIVFGTFSFMPKNISQLERDLISLRTKEGLKSAKARGRNGGRPSKQNAKGDVVRALANSGMKIVDIVNETGLSRSTVNRILRDSK